MRRSFFALAALPLALAAGEPGARPRARDLALEPGIFPPGARNAITDVAGVRVGHTTLIEGDGVRTGVTAVLPHGGNLFRDKVPGAVFVGNAFGKIAGSTQVRELGTIETPIVLTNTLAVGAALEAVVAWTLAQPGNQDVRSVNALVGETNDGLLNDIRSLAVRREHVLEAIRSASAGEVAEGSVGAGTGTVAFGWKGGIGTSSRRLPERLGSHALGTLVQANFGGHLMMDGVPVGREMAPPTSGRGEGSCMIVVATDAPLIPRDLERLAARAIFALARTGSSYAHGSGDYAIAFSTGRSRGLGEGPGTQPIAGASDQVLSALFQAALEATEEAVLNALLRATTVTGRGHTVTAIPIPPLLEILARHGRRAPAAENR